MLSKIILWSCTIHWIVCERHNNSIKCYSLQLQCVISLLLCINYRDGCMKCSHSYCNSVQFVSQYNVNMILYYIRPLHFGFWSAKQNLFYFLFMQVTAIKCYMVLPTQLWLIHLPSLCTDEWRSTTCTLIPSVFLTKKRTGGKFKWSSKRSC